MQLLRPESLIHFENHYSVFYETQDCGQLTLKVLAIVQSLTIDNLAFKYNIYTP